MCPGGIVSFSGYFSNNALNYFRIIALGHANTEVENQTSSECIQYSYGDMFHWQQCYLDCLTQPILIGFQFLRGVFRPEAHSGLIRRPK